jgi:hypothetical protein
MIEYKGCFHDLSHKPAVENCAKSDGMAQSNGAGT